MNTLSICVSVITALISGMLLFYFQRWQKKADEKSERELAETLKRAECRRKESMLGLQMAEANSQLSYACAMALKRGHANGEVEEAVKAYKKARDDYYTFLDAQAYEKINNI